MRFLPRSIWYHNWVVGFRIAPLAAFKSLVPTLVETIRRHGRVPVRYIYSWSEPDTRFVGSQRTLMVYEDALGRWWFRGMGIPKARYKTEKSLGRDELMNRDGYSGSQYFRDRGGMFVCEHRTNPTEAKAYYTRWLDSVKEN